MSITNIDVPAKEIALKAVITRADGTIEDLGTIAHWHKNPLKNLYYRLLRNR